MVQLLRDYSRALGPHRRRAVAIILAFTLAGLLEALALTMLIPLLGPATGTGDGGVARAAAALGVQAEGLQRLALLVFIAGGLGAAFCKFGADLTLLRLRAGVELSLRDRMTRALLGMDWPEFHRMRLGDITKSLVVEGFNTCYGLQLLIQALGALGVSTVLFTVAVVVSPGLTVFSVAFGGFAALAYRRQRKQVDEHSQGLSVATSAMSDDAESTFGSLKYVRTTGSVRSAAERASRAYADYAATYVLANRAQVLLRLLFEGGGIVFVAGVMGFSILSTGQLQAETIAFLALFYRLAPRLHAVQDQLLYARSYRPWFLSWENRMVSATAHPAEHVGTSIPTHDRSVHVQNVSVHFSAAPEPALQSVELQIGRGQTVAVVGESGSGKTTLLDTISGLVRPSAGQVLIDASDIAGIDLETWQRRLGVVTQETPLYSGTVLENIAWGDPDPDRELAEKCCRDAQAWTFVGRMESGLDTHVGERGGRLSGGERQRLGLARALYRRPWLLLLDEPTSALDAESEAAVLQALRRLKGTVTMVLVTHRIATASIADHIVVMDRGRIVERGDYPGLLLAQGRFRALAAAQGLAPPE